MQKAIRISLVFGLAIAVSTFAQPLAAQTALPKTLSENAADLAAGRTTSEALVQAYLSRIAAIDDAGPAIRAVIVTNPDIIAQARALDAERAAGRVRGLLHGIPILLKDNIESADNMATTAGSLALRNNITRRDAPMVARLRAAGAIILGKSNLSEWANFRGNRSTSGYSLTGGLTRNPYLLTHNACGSSSGSGAGMASRLASGAVGTETDGSIVCPSSVNGVVGFKPTVGLVSRSRIVPISRSQDTAGPMTLTVRDAAIMLTAMAGSDPTDPATVEADARKVDYVAALSANGLRGLRVGIVRTTGTDEGLLSAAITRLRNAGATVVSVTYPSAGTLGSAENTVLLTEFKVDIGLYLQGLPAGLVPSRTLADLIAFNTANAATELQFFGQETFIESQRTTGLGSTTYTSALATARRLSRTDGLDRLFSTNRLDVLVTQTNGVAWRTTLGSGDAFIGPSASQRPAVAGYPHLTVPMGLTNGLPVGLSFIGLKWADAKVLAAGHAFEIGGASLAPRPNFTPSR